MKLFKSAKLDRTAATVEDSLNGLPAVLKKAREAVDNSRRDREQLAIAVDRARAERRTAETNYQAALANLATSESDAVLGNSRPETLRASRTAFTETRDAVGFSEARIAGLQGRLTAADAHIADAERSLQVAWDDWVREKIAALDEEYSRAATALLAVMDKGLAIATALSHGNTLVNLRRMAIPKTASNRTSFFKRSSSDSWRGNAEAVATYDTLTAIRQEVFGTEETESLSELDAAIEPLQPGAPMSADVPVSESD